MYHVFLHHQKAALEKLLLFAADAFQSYNEAPFEFENKASFFLDKTVAYFQSQNQQANITTLQSQKAEITTVKRGFSIDNFVKIEKDRRAILLTTIFKVMKTIEGVLGTDYEKIEAKLKHLEEMLIQATLNGLQNGLIQQTDLDAFKTHLQTVDGIWAKLEEDNQLKIFKKKILLNASQPDIQIVLEAVLGRIAANT